MLELGDGEIPAQSPRAAPGPPPLYGEVESKGGDLSLQWPWVWWPDWRAGVSLLHGWAWPVLLPTACPLVLPLLPSPGRGSCRSWTMAGSHSISSPAATGAPWELSSCTQSAQYNRMDPIPSPLTIFMDSWGPQPSSLTSQACLAWEDVTLPTLPLLLRSFP